MYGAFGILRLPLIKHIMEKLKELSFADLLALKQHFQYQIEHPQLPVRPWVTDAIASYVRMIEDAIESKFEDVIVVE